METTIHPQKVRDFLLQEGNTIAELAREAEMHPNGLRHWRSDEWGPRWPTLVKLCNAIDTINAQKEKEREQD